MTSDSDDDTDRVQEQATRRQHQRAESVESMLSGTEGFLDETKYPTTSEELAVEYADTIMDLPNETESLGSVFDRLDRRFETPAEARAALLEELTGDRTPPGRGESEEDLDDPPFYDATWETDPEGRVDPEAEDDR